MKRFWSEVAVEPAGDGFAVLLDGRHVRTPKRAPLVVPSEPLAEAIADEWRACGETVDARAMKLTGLANAAIDHAAADPEAFAAALTRYAESDLICYRSEGPDALVRRQTESWDVLLEWARRRYDVDFACAEGVMHVAQPKATVERLTHAVAVLDPFRMAAMSPLVTIGGSLVAALAVLEQAIPADSAWEAVSLDEQWQAEQWGEDAEAQAALDNRRADFLAAARMLELLDG